MKQFFLTVFGGLTAIFVGFFLAWGAGTLYKYSKSDLAALVIKPSDGTEIRGLVRYIRYTASEEEDSTALINSAAQSLPKGADGAITASAFLIKDLNNGQAAVQFNHDTLMPIASLTKLVTAVVARKHIPLNSRIVITREIMSTYGNTAAFRPGETLTFNDLIYPLLMVSSNDAAEAFAQSYGRAKFIKAMNDFTQSIGAYRTYFADPSGLSPENVSTADDLAIILDWIRKNDPFIISVTALKSKTVRAHTWINPTHFLSWSNYIGGKNGYTEAANRTVAALFTLGPNKDPYAVVILGSANRDSDMIRLLAKVK